MKFNNYVLMDEANAGTLPAGGGNPLVEPAPSGLPSDNIPPVDGDGFNIKPEDLQDGKYMGKWTTPTEMADHIKNMEDKYANLQRDIANGTKQTDAEIAATAASLQTKQLQTDKITELAPAFIANGMVITDEIRDALVETGLTEMEIKVGAYELKEALDKNANYVGGQENYDIIMDHHAKSMTPEEKVQFNHSIQNPNNSEALMVGLQVMYEKGIAENGETQTPDRIRGNPANTNSIKPYGSKAELMKDKRYADSRTASTADKTKYKQRLAITPENVWKS